MAIHLTVASLLADAARAEDRIAEGSEVPLRSIGNVRLIAAPHDLASQISSVEQGDLVVLDDALAGTDDTPEADLVRRLVTAGATAVVLSPQPAAFVSVALRALLESQSRRLDRVLEIHDRIAASAVSGGGAREIVEALHGLIRHPIALVDGSGRVVATAPDGIVPSDEPMVRQAVTAHDDADGVLLALVEPAAIEPDALIAMEQAATAIATRHAEARAITASQERFAAFALEELISGQASDRADLADRAASLGWDLDIPRAVLLASIDPPTDPTTVGRVLGTIAAAARGALGRDAIVWTRSTTVAALIAPPSESIEDRRPLALALQRELDERVRGVTISIGVGRRVDDPLDLPTSFAQARRAVEVGRWAKGRHVTEDFDELGLERLLAACPAEELTAFVRHTIGALQDYDLAHRSELVATLEAWLDTRNIAEASRRTFVHYNTFKNRLERIETILGPVTTDPARSVECAVALHIARHHEAHGR